MTIAALTKYF